MSFFRQGVSTRGASILAALMLVGILTGIGFLVQSTLPSSAPGSQTALTGVPVSTSGTPEAAAASPAPAQQVGNVPGHDFLIMENLKPATGSAKAQIYKIVVCDNLTATVNYPTLPASMKIPSNLQIGKDKASRCVKNSAGQLTNWISRKAYCPVTVAADDAGALQNNQNCKDLSSGTNNAIGVDQAAISQARAAAITQGLANGQLTTEQVKQMGLDSGTQAALNGAFTEQRGALGESLGTVQSERADLERRLNDITNRCVSAGECTAQDNAEFERLTAEKAAADARERELQAQLGRLSDSQVPLTSGNCPAGQDGCSNVPNPCDTDPSARGCTGTGGRYDGPDCSQASCTPTQRDAYCVANPSVTACRPPNGGGGGGGNGGGGNGGGGGGGNPFGGQNGTGLPNSPFGGACNTRYVCQGNMLYYQSANSFGGTSGQCTTQPMQQCQYGCQQPYGQQTGAGSSLGGIMAGMQIVSSLASMFGGGGNNSSMINTSLSSSCAMSPQSPNGNGTDGQPCSQPPQRPDPAQCTSGTWRPTSATNNGCTTGYQCVPNGSGGGGTPTAQLSCQPKIADVGMQIGFSFSCGNATASAGAGFETGGALSGTTTATVGTPPAGATTATYTLTCINQGVTASSRCDVEIGKASIVMLSNPKQVQSGEISTIGWITSGMDSCVVSSPTQQDFSIRNAGNTSVNGAATSSPITATTVFNLECETVGGDTKIASTTVTII